MIPKVFPLYPKQAPCGSSPGSGPEQETFSTLLSGRSFHLEHIVSNAAVSPDGFWYDQEGSEWVALIQGTARLEFPDGILDLKPGDCLLIESHLKHRVTATSADAVWLALHFGEEPSPAASAPGDS